MRLIVFVAAHNIWRRGPNQGTCGMQYAQLTGLARDNYRIAGRRAVLGTIVWLHIDPAHLR